jgi:hypothetical protein
MLGLHGKEKMKHGTVYENEGFHRLSYWCYSQRLLLRPAVVMVFSYQVNEKSFTKIALVLCLYLPMILSN